MSDKPGTYALLEMNLDAARQSFLMNGYIKVFDLEVSVDVHCQLMPEPEFYFYFLLKWSELMEIRLHAEMIRKTKNSISDPGSADWTVSAKFEQHIIEELERSVQKALEAVHKRIQDGLNIATASVKQAERQYKEAIEKAQRVLDEKRAEYERENNLLEEKLRELDRATTAGKKDRKMLIEEACAESSRQEADATIEMERKLAPERPKLRNKEKTLNEEQAKGDRERNNKLSERDRRRQEFYARFGDAEASLQRARETFTGAEGKNTRPFVVLSYELKGPVSLNGLQVQIGNLNGQLQNLSWYQKALALDIVSDPPSFPDTCY